jgi:chromosome segregation protein
MYLKRLELNGFKSFAASAIVEFSSGITAIVGPNGSGKSNIADAIRWILGEQSMKNIRSQNSKDLIFSGSKKRSRLGKAHVSLCFDNSKGCIPLDYSEVVVSRNIFRDGSGEYFVNENPTKLIDIIEILAKANIGHRGFSVINQGMESEILKYSPAELYELLEEASGVRYLQLKKRRSERRLKITQTNLEKVSSILTELAPHLRFLRHEATKAERKEELKKKLTSFQAQYFFLRIHDSERRGDELGGEKEELEAKSSKIKIQISQLSSKLQEKETTIKKEREDFIHAQKKLEEILDKRAKISEDLANLRAQIQIERVKQPVKEEKKINIALDKIEDEFKYIYSALKKILETQNLAELKDKIGKLLNRMEKIIGREDFIESIKETEKGRLAKFINEQKELEALLEQINNEYENYKTVLRADERELGQEEFFELERELRTKKDDLADLESRLKEINWLNEQTENNFRGLRQEIEIAGMNYEEIKNKKFTEEEKELPEQLEEKINRLKYKIEEIGSVDELTLREYKETKERYDRLSKKLEDLKKAKENLGDLIKQLTKEIRGQFDKKFGIIDDNFNKYFRLLFNGGRAYLKQITPAKRDPTLRENLLSDESESEQQELEQETIETGEAVSKGIEIRATLPGKKIKDLRMFSGGEKALTSIALIFAIISSNPPPFLVLDEVDATLDESNARRFAKLLNEFSKDTQFIVITHNRETMNQADILYGITMGEDGVSKLLSLKLKK